MPYSSDFVWGTENCIKSVTQTPATWLKRGSKRNRCYIFKMFVYWPLPSLKEKFCWIPAECLLPNIPHLLHRFTLVLWMKCWPQLCKVGNWEAVLLLFSWCLDLLTLLKPLLHWCTTTEQVTLMNRLFSKNQRK